MLVAREMMKSSSVLVRAALAMTVLGSSEIGAWVPV